MSENDKSGNVIVTTTGAPSNFENPKWLKAELFENLLQEIVPNYRQIKRFEAKPALAAGENYATVMLRVRIDVELTDGTTKPLSYMMKLPQESEDFKGMMRRHNIFEVEFAMYLEVVPEFEQMYRDVGVEINFSAKCYKLETPSEFGVIVLEDLRPYGYKNANRQEGLDMEHSKAVLKRMAQWHAASATRVETKGPYRELLIEGIYTYSQRPFMDQVNKIIAKSFLKSLKTYEGSELYRKSAEHAIAHMTDELFRLSKLDPSEFNVLNHGDCWTNNVMFRYDTSGKLKDALLIDYQMTFYGTPAKDLLYFLISSTSFDLKVKQYDYFIHFYHEQLVKNLKLLKYPKKLPTLKEIHAVLFKYGVWGLSTALGVMAVALLETHDDANIDSFLGETEAGIRFRAAMFSNPVFRKHMEMLMPWFYNRGVLEV